MRTIVALFVVGLFGVGFTPTRARADACLDEASANAGECRTTCKETYQLAKDTCSNRDHVCVEGCRSTRDTCRSPSEATLAAAVAACNATLGTAKDACRAQFADGSPELDTCIDQAQVVAFACRDSAREQVNPSFKACRKDFNICVKTNCPPSSEPDPVARLACKNDAKDVFQHCLADCLEAKQLTKDTCLNRDHDCVEACRATRDTCRQPFFDTRSTAFAACKTVRDAAVLNCQTAFAAGTPERDTCIDQAQIDAFQCRDTAREQVRPQLNSCSLAFQECAKICPPPGGATTTTTSMP